MVKATSSIKKKKQLIEQTQLLKEMVGVIVEASSPEKIILFGSQARGTAGPHSDYDFLIVDAIPFGVSRSRREIAATIWRSLRRFELPVDILLYNVHEIEYWSQSLNHVVACALREGRVLYERSHPS